MAEKGEGFQVITATVVGAILGFSAGALWREHNEPADPDIALGRIYATSQASCSVELEEDSVVRHRRMFRHADRSERDRMAATLKESYACRTERRRRFNIFMQQVRDLP